MLDYTVLFFVVPLSLDWTFHLSSFKCGVSPPGMTHRATMMLFAGTPSIDGSLII
jgi:hypothetical protein